MGSTGGLLRKPWADLTPAAYARRAIAAAATVWLRSNGNSCWCRTMGSTGGLR
jgi:hypothetical protein